MTVDATWTWLVLVGVIVALAVLRSNPDLILWGGLVLLLVAGVFAKPQHALAGLANEGLWTVAALFVVAEGMRQTGGLSLIGQRLLGKPRSLVDAQARVMLPTAVASAFLNNTPVVAMGLPVIDDWAAKHQLSVSQLLLPLSYAAILGGLCTLIGTSTTLVVNGLMIEYNQDWELGMFELAWVGIPAAVAGLVFILVSSRWWLPDRQPPITTHDDPREYTLEMLVEPDGPLVGRTIEQAGLRHLPGMYLMEIDRDGHAMVAVPSTEVIAAGDRLVFVGVVDSVVDLQKIPGLTPATEQLYQLEGKRSERCLIEAVVSDSCPLINRTIRRGRFRGRYQAAVIAVARNGRRIRGKIGDIVLRPGDTLLLEAHPSFLDLQRNRRDFYLVSEVEGSTPPRHERVWAARLILLAMVTVVALSPFTRFEVSMLKAGMVAAALMILSGCVSGREAKESVDWGVLLAIGAGLGIGRAVQDTGAAGLIIDGLITVVDSLWQLAGGSLTDHPRVMLAIIALLTMVLTNLITAKAAAVLMFPVAIAAAEHVSADPRSFAIAMIVSAAASFASPVGYPTNMMVYGPGGYRFGDYVKFGVPLSLVIWTVVIIVVPWAWPL